MNDIKLIAPSIGRVVWYKELRHSDQMMPALICYVWNDDVVNLAIHKPSGERLAKTSVTLFHGDSEDCPDGQCCWMPYQKRQAEKQAV